MAKGLSLSMTIRMYYYDKVIGTIRADSDVGVVIDAVDEGEERHLQILVDHHRRHDGLDGIELLRFFLQRYTGFIRTAEEIEEDA